MQKSLTRIISAAALATLAGCSSTQSSSQKGLVTETRYQRESTPYSSPNNLKGHELRQVTGRGAPYTLEGVVLHGEAFYAQPNTWQNPGELPFCLVKREGSERSINPENRTVIATADSIYLLQTVMTKDGNPAHRITLATDGPFGTRSAITKYNASNVLTGRFTESEQDAPHKLRTIVIGQNKGAEWYVPAVEEAERCNPNALPFYMMNVTTTSRIISSSGEITLTSPDGIWRPVRITQEAYQARFKQRLEAEQKQKEAEQLRIEEEFLKNEIEQNNPGQTKEVK